MGIIDAMAAAFSGRQADDTERLNRLETLTATAKRGLVAFAETGRALDEIKADELWRLRSSTWGQWCSDELGLTDRRADQLITSARSCQTLIESGVSMPSSERVARELAGLEPADVLGVWQQATAEAGDEQPTAEAVAVIVAKKRKKPTRRTVAKPVTYRVAGATVRITPRRTGFVTEVKALEQALVFAREKEARREAA